MAIWKTIKGYEGLYQVSDQGGVRSLDREIRHSDNYKSKIKGITLKQQNHNSGYVSVALSKDGNVSWFLVHRLVANAFIGEIPDGKNVNHINGDKKDNRVENIEIVTYAENSQHGYSNGLMTNFGESHYNAILKDNDVIKMRDIFSSWSGTVSDFWRKHYSDLEYRTVLSIVRRLNWKRI